MGDALAIRVLVVEDEHPIVQLVSGYLVREGWSVETVDDGLLGTLGGGDPTAARHYSGGLSSTGARSP